MCSDARVVVMSFWYYWILSAVQGEPPLTPEDHLDPVTSRIAQETLVV